MLKKDKVSEVIGRVRVSIQGHIVKVGVSSLDDGRDRGGGLRGKVFGFSRQSRKRLLEMFARLELRPSRGERHIATFITLTYPGAESELPTVERCKADCRAFLERIRRRWPGAGGVWRLEFESSGVRDYHPHFHIILFGLPFIDKLVVQSWWRDVIGCKWERPFTRVESIKSWRGVMSYAGKYVSSEAGGVHYLTYPHATESNGDGMIHTGRLWGVFNRDKLPYAELVEVSIVVGKWFYDLKRSARYKWERVNGLRWAGFTLFVDNPQRWLELALYYASIPGE